MASRTLRAAPLVLLQGINGAGGLVAFAPSLLECHTAPDRLAEFLLCQNSEGPRAAVRRGAKQGLASEMRADALPIGAFQKFRASLG
jgi:hypothetical protein